MHVSGLTPIPEAAIRIFEMQQRIVLPESYTSFLRQVGAGSPDPNCHVNDAHESYFLALLFDPREHRMAEQCFAFPAPAESGFVTIGTNAGGDYFLLSLPTGAVYYFDHEQHDVAIDPGEITWLASSLPALVETLRNYSLGTSEAPSAA